jgi:polyisoprenoid-binding protein YceI
MVNKTVRENTARSLAGTYTIDPDSSHIGFEARHAMVTKVRGSFFDFTGTAVLHGEDPALSKIALTIEVASLGTGNHKRDDHLRTNDFFDVSRYPQIHFVSTDVKRLSEETFELTGNLTIKAVTRPITLEFHFLGVVTDAWGNHCAGFEGRTEVHRKDWGVNFNAALEAGGVLVSEKATLTFDISAVHHVDGAGAHHTGRPVEEVFHEQEIVPLIPGAGWFGENR